MESFWRRATPYSFAQRALSIICTKNLAASRPKWSPIGSRRRSKALVTERPVASILRSRASSLRSRFGGVGSAEDGPQTWNPPGAYSPAPSHRLSKATATASAKAGKINFQHTNKKRSAKNKNSCKCSWQLSAI